MFAILLLLILVFPILIILRLCLRLKQGQGAAGGQQDAEALIWGRLRPQINMAIAVMMAMIWEEAINEIPTHHAIIWDLGNCLTVTCLAVLIIKALIHSWPKTNLFKLTITCVEMLTAWAWKATLNELINIAQDPLAERIVVKENKAHARQLEKQPVNEVGISQADIKWGCQGISLGFAIAATVLGIVLPRLLVAVSAMGLSTCTLLVHIVAVPIAFAWYQYSVDLAMCVVTPHVTEIDRSHWRWTLFASILFALSVVSLCIVSTLRMSLKRWLAAQKDRGAISSAHLGVYDAAMSATFDFLTARMLFAMLQSFYQTVSSSTCFEHTPYALESAPKWIIVLAAGGNLFCWISFVLMHAYAGARADAPASWFAPEASCCAMCLAHCWSILCNTLAITLGFAFFDLYDTMVNKVTHLRHSPRHAQPIVHVAVLGVFILTLIVLCAYSRYFGEWRNALTASNGVFVGRGEATANVNASKDTQSNEQNIGAAGKLDGKQGGGGEFEAGGKCDACGCLSGDGDIAKARTVPAIHAASRRGDSKRNSWSDSNSKRNLSAFQPFNCEIGEGSL